MKALKPKISSMIGGKLRGKCTLEAFLTQIQVCLLVKSSQFSWTKECVFPCCIPERLEINVCIYLNNSDTQINAHNLLWLTVLWI